MPSFSPYLAQLESQGHKVGGEAFNPDLHPMDYAAATTMGIPVIGDLVGAAADARMYAQEPESRTPLNYGLSALGALPFVPGAAGIMRGVKGSMKDPDAIGGLSDAMKSTKSPEEVFMDTGWYQGADKQWRNEISDYAATINFDKMKLADKKPGIFRNAYESMTGKNVAVNDLKEILDHPDFFKAYPDFNPKVMTYYNPIEGSLGGYDEASGYILVNLSPHYDHAKELLGSAKHPAFKKTLDNLITNTMLHEAQHGVQGIENFARGGDAFNPNYHKLAGEVESRMIEQRRNLLPTELRQNMPMDNTSVFGMDVPMNEQVIEYSDHANRAR